MLLSFFRNPKALISIFFAALVVFFLLFVVAGESSDRLTFEAAELQEASEQALAEVPRPPTHLSTPEPVRAIYMTSWVAGTPSLRDGLIRFIETSEINSIVIDIKDYTGKISFVTEDPVIHELQAEEERIRNIRELIDSLHVKNIYVIGRISVFQDPYLANRRPEWAVLAKTGGVWKDRKGLSFIDPAAQPYWDYTVRIAREAEMDLVEVSPTAVPPVCRVLNYGKFLYERAKKESLKQMLLETMVPDVTVFNVAWLIEKDLSEFYEKMANRTEGRPSEALHMLAEWERGHERFFRDYRDRLLEEYSKMPWGG